MRPASGAAGAEDKELLVWGDVRRSERADGATGLREREVVVKPAADEGKEREMMLNY